MRRHIDIQCITMQTYSDGKMEHRRRKLRYMQAFTGWAVANCHVTGSATLTKESYRYLRIILFYLHFLAKSTFRCRSVSITLFYLQAKCQHLVRSLTEEILTFILFYIRFCLLLQFYPVLTFLANNRSRFGHVMYVPSICSRFVYLVPSYVYFVLWRKMFTFHLVLSQ